MTEFRESVETVRRRTYLTGHLTGKSVGPIDQLKSDIRRENFFELELYDAEIKVQRADIRKYTDGGEIERFREVEVCLTKLPNPIGISITAPDEEPAYYLVNLLEPKLKNIRLVKQLYEGKILFTTLEGDISGFIVHEEKVVTKVPIEVKEPLQKEQMHDEVQAVNSRDKIPEIAEVAGVEVEGHAAAKVLNVPQTDAEGTQVFESFKAEEESLTENQTSFVSQFRREVRRFGAELLRAIPVYTYPRKMLRESFRRLVPFFTADRAVTGRGCLEVLLLSGIGFIASLYIILVIGVILAVLLKAIGPFVSNFLKPLFLLLLSSCAIVVLRRNIPVSTRWVIPAVILLLLFAIGLGGC